MNESGTFGPRATRWITRLEREVSPSWLKWQRVAVEEQENHRDTQLPVVLLQYSYSHSVSVLPPLWQNISEETRWVSVSVTPDRLCVQLSPISLKIQHNIACPTCITHSRWSPRLWQCQSNLKQQLVFGEALDRFQQVGIQAQFVLQLFLTLLHQEDK